MKTDQTLGSAASALAGHCEGFCTDPEMARAANANLVQEINRLRLQILRYLDAENASVGGLDYDARLATLRAVHTAAEGLNRLVRLQTLLYLQSGEWK